MSPQCTFNTGGLWQRQPRLLVLFRLVLQDLLHSQPSDWLSLTEKHSILRFLIQKFLNRVQVYFMLPTPESILVMAGNYSVSAPRGRKSRMRNSWDCPFNKIYIATKYNLQVNLMLAADPRICFSVLFLFLQSHLYINILAWPTPLMTFFTGKVFPLRLANPLIGARGLYKRKRTLWHEMLCKKSKSVDSEPTCPTPFSRGDFFLNNNHFPLNTSYWIVLRSELRIHISSMTITQTA